jgi:hypothetical protein
LVEKCVANYTDKELQRAVDELENVLNNIEIQDNGKYYVFSEEIWRDDA